MNLRLAAVIALGMFAIALVLPAFGDTEETIDGYETFVTSFTTAFTFLTPDSLNLFATGTPYFDRYIAMLAFGGASANVTLLLAIICSFRQLAGWTLLAATIASLNAAAILILMAFQDGPVNARLGCILWFGSTLWMATVPAYVWLRDAHQPAGPATPG